MSNELPTFNFAEFTTKKLDDRAGEFGTVYAASHRHFRSVAIRVISRRRVRRPDQDRRLLEEARRLFSITSENVIRLLGVVMDDVLGLIFEFAEFGPLDKLLVRHNMGRALKVRVAHEVAQGMFFLHSRNILHLRLKCRNILMSGNIQAKISDLFFHHSNEMRTWSAIASHSTAVNPQAYRHESTVDYIPPECYRNINLPPEKSWDVYAYAIILWGIMSRKAPYVGETEVCRKVAEGLRPDLLSVEKDRGTLLHQLMEKSWQNDVSLRPTFEHITDRLNTALRPLENEAREQALSCRKDIEEFYFPEKNLRHPEGDLYEASDIAPTSNSGHSRDISQRNAPDPTGTSSRNGIKIQSNTRGHIQSDCATPHHGIVVDPTQSKNFATPIWLSADDSTRKINVSDLYTVAACIENFYHDFGEKVLKLTRNDIGIIEEQYDDSLEISYQMLRRWKEASQIMPTVSYLVRILKDNGYLHIANHLNP